MVDVWSFVVPCVDEADEFTSVELWLVLTLLDTLWSPEELTLTPGLTFAPTLRSVLLMPTFASTPTFGFTFSVGFIENVPVESAVLDDVELPGCAALVVEDCVPEVLCEVEADELRSVDVWLVDTPLVTDWSPELPTLTPGLTLAPTLRSLLLMFTFAPTPTFGFTLVLLVDEAEGAFVPLPEVVAALGELEPERGDVDVGAVVLLTEELDERAPGCVAGEVDDARPASSELDEVEEPVAEPLTLPEVLPAALLFAPLVLPVVAEPEVVPEVLPEAWVSGVQSMCTGLEERSFAIPVDLSASLPAFGWLSSLQSGLAAVVPAVPVAADLAFEFALDLASARWDVAVLSVVAPVELLLDVCAKAGAAPSSAAMARVLK